MSEINFKLYSEGGYIFDWGCGSGRDTHVFKKNGYRVVATDASEELLQDCF